MKKLLNALNILSTSKRTFIKCQPRLTTFLSSVLKT